MQKSGRDNTRHQLLSPTNYIGDVYPRLLLISTNCVGDDAHIVPYPQILHKKAPLCKGSCHEVTEGLLIAKVFATPPDKIKDFAHLPLHRGGFVIISCCSVYRADNSRPYGFGAQKKTSFRMSLVTRRGIDGLSPGEIPTGHRCRSGSFCYTQFTGLCVLRKIPSRGSIPAQKKTLFRVSLVTRRGIEPLIPP